MRALQLTGPGTLELRETPVPEIGPTDLLLRVGAAGLCHSDLHVLAVPVTLRAEPMTLGHEIAGTIEAVGAEVEGRAVGERGLVYLCWSCGVCRECVSGNENVCLAAGRAAMPPCPGLGPDGGMAEYVRIPANSFVPIGEMEFDQAAPLADAALTSYHAIRGAREELRPGATAVVVGVGGLGHVAVQILKAITAVRIVAVDIAPDKLELAGECGADLGLRADGETATRILELTDGRGAEAVFDFVGNDATARLSVEAVAPNGAYRMVGLAGGNPGIDAGPAGGPGLPWGATVRKSYAGTKSDLLACVALARSGALRMSVERFDLADGPTAVDRLERGLVRGRAVLIP
ncbi:alcohol dehydrogenase catalytic domain-containing protein [Nocardia pseudobrasiliensis]|uniref:Propanol-preferring alcohol dehydrogenase n=1 Tax=Nocardia pseudobrasiliensis TaxID=45979 RepID=A0A370IDJ6_9NOCA|nr:alcohol dehydrogenase catalytic domain-containing protein [Nocardia pseudobrasiliensis]RDI68796.1 propanol-preferring alcohol dehydrogenase [Nocardia pseudobrasiliensis]